MCNERMGHEVFTTITSNTVFMSPQYLTISSLAADLRLVQCEACLLDQICRVIYMQSESGIMTLSLHDYML